MNGTLNQRNEDEANRLLEIFKQLPPTGKAEPTQEKKSDKWRHRSVSGVRNNGRVNRTKGK
jgi:hypothetical protein